MRCTSPLARRLEISAGLSHTRRSRNICLSSSSVFKDAATNASWSNTSQKQRLESVTVGAHSHRSRRDIRSETLKVCAERHMYCPTFSGTPPAQQMYNHPFGYSHSGPNKYTQAHAYDCSAGKLAMGTTSSAELHNIHYTSNPQFQFHAHTSGHTSTPPMP